MLAAVPSATLLGVDGHPVSVEVHVSAGLPGFTVVGLPDAACREARDRVRAALLSSGHEWPMRRVTVNLAPSGQRKGGSGLDLAIAVALLVADDKVPSLAVEGLAFLGELGLDGSVRAVPGALPLVAALDGREAVVPVASVVEARLVGRHVVRPVADLRELVAALTGDAPWPDPPGDATPAPAPTVPDLADVRGQPVARRAAELAAAGGHHLLMVGPPGAGKSMLAQRLVGLLPPLPRAEALAVTRVHSSAGERLPPGGLIAHPPFRSPHHSASLVSLVGGGTRWLRPGEISLAHGGVLFLDELGEFARATLDALRQPLEEGVIRVSRAHSTVQFPARFLLVAAMNPCPCGAAGGPGSCQCSDSSRVRYARRVSGPLLDRFDLRVNVHRPEAAAVFRGAPGESTEAVAERVAEARLRAAHRGVLANGALHGGALERAAPLTDEAIATLEGEMAAGRLSARGAQRARCVARTLADLAGGSDRLDAPVVRSALRFRATPSFRRSPTAGPSGPDAVVPGR
jgi:magnesium chelatase family protein